MREGRFFFFHFFFNVAKHVIVMGEDGLRVCFLGRENTPLELLKLEKKELCPYKQANATAFKNENRVRDR